MTPALALLFNHASAASAACARPGPKSSPKSSTRFSHKRLAQGGYQRAGWLELEQSNSVSFENESLKTLTSAFCHQCHRFPRKRSGSSWRQQLAATARETVEACDTSVGVFPRDREAQEAGSRHALGTGNRRGRPEVPGQTGVAGSSRQQPGAGRRSRHA